MEGGGGAIGVTDEKGVRIFCHDPVIGQCFELHLLPAAGGWRVKCFPKQDAGQGIRFFGE